MLPEMEQANTGQRLNFSLDLEQSILAGANVTNTDSLVPFLICPSDPYGESIYVSPEFMDKHFAHTGYLGTQSDPETNASGMFGIHTFLGLRDVVDGTSQTLFVGERGVDHRPSATGEFGWWILGAPGNVHDGRRRDAARTQRRSRCGQALVELPRRRSLISVRRWQRSLLE